MITNAAVFSQAFIHQNDFLCFLFPRLSHCVSLIPVEWTGMNNYRQDDRARPSAVSSLPLVFSLRKVAGAPVHNSWIPDLEHGHDFHFENFYGYVDRNTRFRIDWSLDNCTHGWILLKTATLLFYLVTSLNSRGFALSMFCTFFVNVRKRLRNRITSRPRGCSIRSPVATVF